MFETGEIIRDKYQIQRPIGVGGMGLVFRARHRALDQDVAIKVLRSGAARDPELVERFRREARVMASVDDPHVLRALDVEQLDDGTPLIVMELLRGCDLRTELAERGPLPIEEAVDYLLQACDGAAAVHAAGYVHRDLKPQNLFVTAEGAVDKPLLKLLDFGIAKIVRPDDMVSTTAMSGMGTPKYMSPEQIRSAKYTDARTDVWALGVILFELLTQRTPFVSDSRAGMLGAILADPPIPLRDLRPDAPDALELVILRALQKDPDERFASARELKQALLPFAQPARLPSERRQRLMLSVPPVALPMEASERATALQRPAGRTLGIEIVEAAAADKAAPSEPQASHGAAPVPGRTRRMALVSAGLSLGALLALLTWTLVSPESAAPAAAVVVRSPAPVVEPVADSQESPAVVVDLPAASTETPAAAQPSVPVLTAPVATDEPAARPVVAEKPRARRAARRARRPPPRRAKAEPAASSPSSDGLPLHL